MSSEATIACGMIGNVPCPSRRRVLMQFDAAGLVMGAPLRAIRAQEGNRSRKGGGVRKTDEAIHSSCWRPLAARARSGQIIAGEIGNSPGLDADLA